MEANPVVIGINESAASGARPQPALSVLAAALVVGMVGDSLLRATPWGINLMLCMASLALAIIALAGRGGAGCVTKPHALLMTALLFAAGCAWRDSAILKTLDVLAVMLVFALAAWRAQGGSLVMGTISNYLRGVGLAAARTLFGGPALVFCDVSWARLPGRAWRQAIRTIMGFLIALPLLMVFTALLASADAVFERWAMAIFDIDIPTIMSHLALTGILAAMAGGYLRALLLQRRPDAPPRAGEPGVSLGNIEVGVVLGLVNALFLTFVVVQFRHFFGGEAQVQVVPGLSYAAYARRGFFELVTVAALLLPLLWGADWLLRKETRKTAFRVLSGALVVMLCIIMASAVQRMRLYQSEYGLTELRLYTTAFMGWLAVVFVWFAATVLRGHRERFVFGALVAGGVAVVALHVANPDALIVRANVALAKTGRAFDARYAASLSADAVPTWIAALPELRRPERTRIVAMLRKTWLDDDGDWRTWNWSRAEARRQVTRLAAGELAECRNNSGEPR